MKVKPAETVVSVGLDVHKETVTIAVAVGGGDPEVMSTVRNTPIDVRKALSRLQTKGRLQVVYERRPGPVVTRSTGSARNWTSSAWWRRPH